MDRIERIMSAIAGLAVLVVVAFVVVGPLRSEVAKATMDHLIEETAATPWVPAPRRRRAVEPPAPIVRGKREADLAREPASSKTERAPVRLERRPSPSVSVEPPRPGEAPASSLAPARLPPEVREKYRHLVDLEEVGATASSEPVTLADGQPGLALRDVQPDSPLRTILGFESGDVVVSVNGYAPDRDAAPRLFEALKDEHRFEVVIVALSEIPGRLSA